jgi:DNA-binding NtrC family response regulator
MSKFTTLFVDDEKDFLETILNRMKKRQMHVYGAESGEEALSFLEHTPVEVVVLDVKMPGMGGIETLKEIKKRFPLIEVIMLTGHASLEVAKEGMEAGAYDYLMKPVNIDELLYKLQDAQKSKSIQDSKMKHLRSQLKR